MSRDDLIREIQESYKQSGQSLNELQRRHWAATEARKLGHGGITIVSKALQMSPNTIKKGIQEIATGRAVSYKTSIARIRKSGGGRKSKQPTTDQITRTRSKNDPAAT